MELTLLAILLIFGAGLLVGRKHPLVLSSALFLVIGVLASGTGAGDFIRTMLTDAYRFFT